MRRQDTGSRSDPDLQTGPPATIARVEGYRAWIEFERERLTAPRLIAELQQQGEVEDLSLHEPDIELILHRSYQENAATA